MVVQKPLEDQLIGVSNRQDSRVEIRVEPTARWVRAVVGGVAVADSKQVLTVTLGLPVYYFPRGDVRTDLGLRLPARPTIDRPDECGTDCPRRRE